MLHYAPFDKRMRCYLHIAPDNRSDIDGAIDPQAYIIPDNRPELLPPAVPATDFYCIVIVPEVCDFCPGSKVTASTHDRVAKIIEMGNL